VRFRNRIMARPRTSVVVWLRRTCQACSVLLFLYLFLETVYKPVNETGRGIKLFFQLDPLTALSSGLGTWSIVSGLLLGGATVAVTLLAGRWFCGWVCPFGALHNLLSGWRADRLKQRILVGGYSGWQKSKYYVLTVMLVGCLLGLNLAGLLDPFSFFYRSLAVVVFPAANDMVTTVFTWVYQVNPGIGSLKATAITEPVYEVLRRNILAVSQPHYRGTLLVALLFVAVVFLNLYRARFWCRYICPLGALLGIVGKNPLVRLSRIDGTCNNCGLCVSSCQGGANPTGAGAWKPSECFYCWNCRSACPHRALTFTVGAPREGLR
jgi:polyferredoxin